MYFIQINNVALVLFKLDLIELEWIEVDQNGLK